jgi:hypothetical protein
MPLLIFQPPQRAQQGLIELGLPAGLDAQFRDFKDHGRHLRTRIVIGAKYRRVSVAMHLSSLCRLLRPALLASVGLFASTPAPAVAQEGRCSLIRDDDLRAGCRAGSR